MILSFDGNGNIKTLVPSRVYQGSNKASTISIVAPFSEPNTMSIFFRLPNAETTEPLSLIGGNEFYSGMFIWTLDIDKSITKYAGQVNFQVNVTNTNGEVVATGSSYFMVEKGVVPSLPKVPSAETYKDILAQLTNLYTSKVDRVDIYNVPSDIKFELNGYKTPNVVYYDKESGYSLFVNHFKIPENSFQKKLWNGFDDLYARGIWHDTLGNTYYSNKDIQYKLEEKTNTWIKKDWGSLNQTIGIDNIYIWEDGENTYFSYGESNKQYILNKKTLYFEPYTWNGFGEINGRNIWKTKNNIYHTNNSDKTTYKYNKNTGSWTKVEIDFSEVSYFATDFIWDDGISTYISGNENDQFIFDEENLIWKHQIWNKLVLGQLIWTDNVNVYYSVGSTQYVLNKETNEWEDKKWELFEPYGNKIWHNKNKIYYSNGSDEQLYISDKSLISQVEVRIDKEQNFYTRYIFVTNDELHSVIENSDWIYLNKKILSPLLKNISFRIENNSKEINNISNKAQENLNKINKLEPRVDKNEKDILSLKESLETGENYVGQLKGNELPNDSKLDAFVLTQEGRESEGGDVIFFILEIPNATDEIYKYTYSVNKKSWNYYKIPSIEPSKNKTLGIIEGSYYEGNSSKTQLDINNGVVENIYVKPKDILIELNELLFTLITNINTNKETIDSNIKKYDDIMSGKTKVPKAISADNDSFGNNISNTYVPKTIVYTKDECNELFLPSTYTNIYYYSKNGIVDDVPTEPADQKQFEVTSNTIGDTLIFKVDRTTIAKYNFNKNTTDQSSIWVSVDRDCELNFRLTTKGSKGGVEKLLNAELTGILPFKANELKQINIKSIYSNLGNEEYKLDIGDKFIKEFEVITTESTPTKVTIYSGVVNASSVNLVAESISFNVNTINNKKLVYIRANEWVDNGDGTYTATIMPLEHEQAPSTQYGLDLQYRKDVNTVQRLEFTPEISEDGTIKITSYKNIDCELLIWSAIDGGDIGIITLENPTNIPDVDYNAYGVIRITQNIEPTNLTLPEPKNVGAYYSIFVSNSKLSTKKIIIEGFNIEVNNGLRFKWNGENWQIAETPDKTSEITDDLNNQPLNNTLKEIPNKANKDGSNIQVEVWQNILGVDLKANNKSVELKEGLAVDNLIDFFRHFYDLRKGVDDTWEFEVGEGKNENIMNIFGFPYGESPTNSAELIVKRIATSGIGYTLELTFASKKSNTTHTAFVRGWIISGTSYDKYIHFTGWRNARGGQWVDEVNGEVTLTDTNELVLNIGEFKNPYNNFLIAEVTKNNHSYNAFLMLSITAPNIGETTIKLDNEDVYVKVDYNAKTFTISKTSSGSEKLTVHLYEKLI